jgi:hypothetical protein
MWGRLRRQGVEGCRQKENANFALHFVGDDAFKMTD